MKGDQVNRRTAMKAAGCGTAAVVLGQTSQLLAEKKVEVAKVEIPKYATKDFYADGKFDAEKGKQAYLDMVQRLGYPVSEPVKKNLFATDFATGDFLGCGLGFILWHNSEKYGYCSIEIFLLPGQMIAEHAHGKSSTRHGPKMEAWTVRHGMIYTFGEGEATKPLPIELPASQKEKFITVWNAQPLMPGETRELNRLEAMHFMIAGPQGAIVTEFSTYHDGGAIRFTNPGVKF